MRRSTGRIAMTGGSGPGGKLTEDDARALLAAWKASGSSLSAFARGRGLGAERLRWWKKRLSHSSPDSQASSSVRLLPVRVLARREGVRPVGEREQAAAFDVRIGSGAWSVRVPAEFDEPALRRLLATLTEMA
jgi:hypothetical protein